ADVTVNATANLTAVGQSVDLLARYSGQGDTNYYSGEVAKVAGGFTATIYYTNSLGVRKLLVSKTVATFFGAIQFQVIGNVLTLSMDGVPQIAITDNSITTAGTIGMRTSAGVSVTSFTARW